MGNHPLATRSRCSKSSLMVQKEENPNTPNKLDQNTSATNAEAATAPMPSNRKIHHGRVPK